VSAPADADLEALWHDWHRRVLAYALRRADPATAEDVVAETFVIAWRRLDRLPDPPLPWLLGVARRVLANARRGERRRLALLDRLRGQQAAVTAPLPGVEGWALAALGLLSERDREALMLHAWDGLDNADAGTVMGCSAATYAVRLHRARERFARALADLDRVDESVREVTR
jgi:DNA-directed RNA polymerase specialized sigma24 family protein